MTPPQARQLTLDEVDGSAPLGRSTEQRAEDRAPEGERKPVAEAQPSPRRAAGRIPDATAGRVRGSRAGRRATRGGTAPDLGFVGVAPQRSLLTADQVAVKLGMDKEWIWEQSRRDRIPTIRLGRFYRYREDAIDAWLASMERGSVRPPIQE